MNKLFPALFAVCFWCSVVIAQAEEAKSSAIQEIAAKGINSYKAGDIKQANSFFLDAVKLAETKEPQGATLAKCLVNLGSCQRDLKDFESSECSFKRAIAIYEKKPNDSRADFSYALKQYARLLRQTTRSKEAQAASAKADELLVAPVKKDPQLFNPDIDVSFLDFYIGSGNFYSLSGKVTNTGKRRFSAITLWVYKKNGLQRVGSPYPVNIHGLGPRETVGFDEPIASANDIDGYEIFKIKGVYE